MAKAEIHSRRRKPKGYGGYLDDSYQGPSFSPPPPPHQDSPVPPGQPPDS